MNIIQTNMNPLTFTQHPAPTTEAPRRGSSCDPGILESLDLRATMEVPGGLLWFHQDPGGSEFSIQWGPVLGESKNPVIVHLEQFPPLQLVFPRDPQHPKYTCFFHHTPRHDMWQFIGILHGLQVPTQWCGENSPGDPFVIEIQVPPLARCR